ncbi:ATP-grasp domain-containing protein [Clostridium sp. AM58-1XD]|uniref:ATP-grasp domain-containing protein n=1 Tax=Clostridium sp. AM58-1XD TaxID=2292307 RepID=UPI001FA860C5|nr:ATP-grasp domain-containing protein [Clostridium sp. AM58-1XD]
MISTVDIDEVCRYAEKNGIDGIFCGVSEINLAAVREAAERLKLPCYHTKEQWEIFQNKAEFKKLCTRFGLLTPKEYSYSDCLEQNKSIGISYPLIVKPSDCSASIGVHICNDIRELKSGYKDAMEKSPSDSVIIEEYLIGKEFSATMFAIDGEYGFSALCTKSLNKTQKDLLPLADASIYPAKETKIYLDTEMPKISAMFRSIGYCNGAFFLQGMFANGKFYFFECGLRLGGGAVYRFVSKINKFNDMELMTQYALTGKMDLYSLDMLDANLRGKRACILFILSKGGTIGRIEGVNRVLADERVVYIDVRHKAGDTIPRNGTLQQRQFICYCVCDSEAELTDTIKFVQDALKVFDTDGKNMLYPDFEVKRIMQENNK